MAIGTAVASPPRPIPAHIVQAFLEGELAVGHVEDSQVALSWYSVPSKTSSINVYNLMVVKVLQKRFTLLG